MALKKATQQWEAPERPHVACCFAGCGSSALARVWTSTGWANVCLDCYPRINTVNRPSESPFVKERRDVYLNRGIKPEESIDSAASYAEEAMLNL